MIMEIRQLAKTDIITRVLDTVERHALITADQACLLMVSGGSDSTALAYIAADLRDAGSIGSLAMMHVDHQLRGVEAKKDAQFASELASLLDIPFFLCEIDIAKEAARTGENVEAVARRERYLAANEALMSLCQHASVPFAEGRILTAHTSDDRIENFYMRSIVGTGPGGFRSMLYRNGPVVRPLLDLSREDLREFIERRQSDEMPVALDEGGCLWREDATNAHTDRFRAYVRHEIIPKAKEWNAQMPANLIRTMNLIADEDEMVDEMADAVLEEDVLPLWVADAQVESSGVQTNAGESGAESRSVAPTEIPTEASTQTCGKTHAASHTEVYRATDCVAGFLLQPSFGYAYKPLQRRVVHKLLKAMLGADERIDAQSVEAILAGFSATYDGEIKPCGGYVTNIQGDLAVSANKYGVRVEPMAAFRRRRKKD